MWLRKSLQQLRSNYTKCLTTTTATPAPGRGRLYDTEQTRDIILQSVSDAESDDEDFGEPMCPGSDEEFPDPNIDNIR